jgi:hypothetical protein
MREIDLRQRNFLADQPLRETVQAGGIPFRQEMIGIERRIGRDDLDASGLSLDAEAEPEPVGDDFVEAEIAVECFAQRLAEHHQFGAELRGARRAARFRQAEERVAQLGAEHAHEIDQIVPVPLPVVRRSRVRGGRQQRNAVPGGTVQKRGGEMMDQLVRGQPNSP